MRALAACFAVLLSALAAHAEPLAREDVPEPLRPWVDWVLRGHEAATCPFLAELGNRECVWPGQLSLALDASGGTFEQDVFVAIDAHVPLPGGGDGAWPEDVRAGSEAVPVDARDGEPAVRLARGVHHLSGRFVWSAPPPGLRVPASVGLVELTLNGQRVARPRRDEGGTLWLRDPGAQPAAIAAAENRADVEVHRRLEDGVPVRLETEIRLRISGEAREELLGIALPAGTLPTALHAQLPARIDPDGRLRVQLRPGEWTIRVQARVAERGDSFGPPAQPKGARWDGAEIWAVALAPELRLVEIEGAPSIDPTQTEMPPAWRELPAYRLEPGTALRFVEKRRGNQGSAADQLALQRTWHLDFDGAGATVIDRIQGTLRSSLRLEMGERTALGRVAVGGQDQPITRRAGAERLGVEVVLGGIALEADSRVEGGARRLPAVGWDRDFDSVAATLMIPPGYRLLHASGVDDASPTWIADWDLLSVFFVMLIGVAVWRLFGTRIAALALAALALSWTESGAPALVWLALVVMEALRRVATRGRLARWVRLAHLATGIALLAIAVPFAIHQVRVGLFPALERPWQRADSMSAREAEGGFGLPQAAAPEMAADASAIQDVPVSVTTVEAPSLAMPSRMRARGSLESVSSYGKSNFAPDPSARIPTGPGRPDWSWQQVDLSWSGPVTRDQQLGLWLLPPWANAGLAIVRVLLIVAFGAVFARAWRARETGGDGPNVPRAPSDASAAPIAIAVLLGAALAPIAARADLPTPELLEQLRASLLEPPECGESCATISRLALAVAPERLELRAAIDASAETGVPLPGGGAGESAWTPSGVLLDGQPAAALRRDDDGVLWLRLTPGHHEIQLVGALPPRATVELPLPLAPKRVVLATRPAGWAVVGIQPDGAASGALQLVRAARAARDPERPDARLEPSAIPRFVQLTRALELGLSWSTRTVATRIAPEEGAIVVEVPLLAGESVTTPGVRVERGRALITIPAGEREAAYVATLAIAERIELAAPTDAPWTERWEVAAGPLWHVEAEGIPPVDELREGQRAREWRPWPGEKLALAIERPAGSDGATLTLDRSQLALAPGLRATDANLTLALRSSQGGQHAITLPEGAQLTSLVVNGIPQPLRQEGARVPLTLTPGAREVQLGWREPRGASVLYRSSAVDLGAPSVNAHVEIAVPENRWVLFAGGPRLGPSVMFWSTLAIVAALAWGLGQLTFTPLRAQHWLLLGVGLTQAPYAASVPVVACLLLLGVRGRAAARVATLGVWRFRLLQLALVLLTLAAAAALVYAIQHGLLGTPEMRIAGNGSDSFALRWYADRSAAQLPVPWVASLSIWWYRAAMLAWSLWLALALVGWARWAFVQWSAGGMFRPEPQPAA
jgi:hypothetical protein